MLEKLRKTIIFLYFLIFTYDSPIFSYEFLWIPMNLGLFFACPSRVWLPRDLKKPERDPFLEYMAMAQEWGREGGISTHSMPPRRHPAVAAWLRYRHQPLGDGTSEWQPTRARYHCIQDYSAHKPEKTISYRTSGKIREKSGIGVWGLRRHF